MLNELNKDQRLLAERMSDISERAYCASWMKGLEHFLWAAVLGSDRQYGRHIISDSELAELQKLSNICGGWIFFDEEDEESFVSLADWKEKYFRPDLTGAGFT